MNAKQLFLLAVLMGLYGCAFEPHEEFVSPIKPPEAITVTFELDDPVFNQPFYLVEPTLFRIKLHDTSHPLLSVEVIAGGSEVPSGIDNSHDFYFFLEPDRMGIGKHSVSIRCFLDTESGSLANLAGTEIYVVDQSFEISIDPKRPTFDSFRAGIENEYFTLNWNPPQDQRNYVYKIELRSYSHYWHYPDTVIYEPQVSRFIDYGYLGGHLYYKVTVKGYGFEFVLGEGSIEEEPADFTAFRSDDKKAILSWSNRKLSGENAVFSVSETWINEGAREFPLTPSGEVVIGDLPLGQGIWAYLTYFRRGYEDRKVSVAVSYNPTPNLKPFVSHILLGESKKLLIGTQYVLYRYNLENNFELEDSLMYYKFGWNPSVVLSPDESKAYISGYDPDNVRFTSVDPQNFNDIKYHDMSGVFAALNLPVNFFRLNLGNASNNGLLTMEYSGGSGHTFLYDSQKEKFIWQSPPNNSRLPVVSSDGKFFAANTIQSSGAYEGWVFGIGEEDIQPLGKIDPGFPVFLPNGTEIMSSLQYTEMSGVSGTHLSVFDLKNLPGNSNNHFTRLRSVAMPTIEGLENAYYDPGSNYVAFSYEGQLKLFNVATMRFEKTIKGQKQLYSGNYLLSPTGFIELAP